jgi:hypothetical protein
LFFERQNGKFIDDPSEKRVRLELSRLRSYGKSSFASLTSSDGSFVQVAGGTVNCALEWRDEKGHHHYRGYQDPPKVPHPDGTLLMFGGGTIRLNRNEFFFIEQVTEVFLAFLAGHPFPSWVKWREITEELGEVGIVRP